MVTPDGAVWSDFGMAQKFWGRYLEVFEMVRIVARGRRVEHAVDGWLPVTGKGIQFHAVPDFHGPWQYVKRAMAVRTAIRSAAPTHGAVILRVPSQIGNILEGALTQSNRPYALEVVGDPYEVFGPGVVNHPLRQYFRRHFSKRLKEQCLHAAAVAYVTKFALQQRYPTRGTAANISDVDLSDEAVRGSVYQTHYSNIELDPEYVVESHDAFHQKGPFQLVTVGSLAQRYKGTDVLIRAIARCVQAGVDLTAVIVGDGMYKQELMELTECLGVSSRIHFSGHLPAGRAVRDVLDASDLFVLPSRTEGLPRAMIEAMARGLPCIGSDVGGIPELLSASELVPVGNAEALAVKIQEVLLDPQRIEALSHKNIEAALQYRDSILSERRRHYYQIVKEITQQWEARQ
jgi:glycosyltransferase involved in cell wall biosynthesis